MMILLEKHTGLAVNPADVSSISTYTANGFVMLEVRMTGGEKHRVRHAPEGWNGDDVYAIHKQLLEAK